MEAVESNVRKEIANIDGKCTTVQELLRQERAERDAGHGFLLERLEGLEVKQNNEFCQVNDSTGQQLRELRERVDAMEKFASAAPSEFVVEPTRPLYVSNQAFASSAPTQAPSLSSTFPSPGGPGSVTLSVSSAYAGSAVSNAVNAMAAQAAPTNVTLAAHVAGTATTTPPVPATAAVVGTIRPPSPTLPVARREFSPRRSMKVSPRRPSISTKMRQVTPPPPARSSSPLANRRATMPITQSAGQLPGLRGSFGVAGGSGKLIVGTMPGTATAVAMSPGGQLTPAGSLSGSLSVGLGGPLPDGVDKPKKIGGTPPPQTKSVTAFRSDSNTSASSVGTATGSVSGGPPHHRAGSMNSSTSARTVTPSGTARVEASSSFRP